MTVLLTILSAIVGGALGCVLGVTYPDPQGRKPVTIAMTLGVAAFFVVITLGARA